MTSAKTNSTPQEPLASELALAIGSECVLIGDDIPDRAMSDESRSGRNKPGILLRPRTSEAVSEALRICARHGRTVVPQGGMTGLAGGACPRAEDVALSLDAFNGVENIDPVSMTMTVRAGTILQDAQKAAEDCGLMLPIDLGARGSCQIGGVVATNAGGIRVLRYGMTRENLLGLEVVLADGTIISDLGGMIKNNTGYDIAKLFAGSEGTLGIITRAVIRLRPLPMARQTALCALSGFDDVMQLLHHARQDLPGLSAFELMWGDYFDLLQDLEGVLMKPAPAFAVIIESETMDRETGDADFEAFLARMFDENILADALVAQSSRESARFWAVREGDKIYEAMPHLINLDISISLNQMERFVTECKQAITARFRNVRALFYGHAGDGNLHIALDIPDSGDSQLIHDVETCIYDKVREMRGSISAEHGIGTLKRDYLSYSRSPSEIALMRQIKQALDPSGIMNPGKVL